MDDLIPFGKKVRQILKEKEIPTNQFGFDTGIARRILYNYNHKISKSTLMAIAYYLDMKVEDLVDGTDAMDYWYC